jgi:hypothetical protein
MFPTQLQVLPTHAEKAIQTIQLDFLGESHVGKEKPRVDRQSIPLWLLSQKTYRSNRLRGFCDSNVIKFFVNGEEGIRLSDASEGVWVGLDDRDERLLFEGRSQIMVRLHVRLFSA